jgi:hypothetical protein
MSKLPWIPTPERTLTRLAVVVAGTTLLQAVLYGPSLAGWKILMPLDLLATLYLPTGPDIRSVEVHDKALSDQVLAYEFRRRFAADELRSGRLPLWDPYCYAGAPFAHYWTYSPFNLFYCCFPSPRTLAWTQLLVSLLASVGAYLFFGHVLGVSFWPAAIGAWCCPITGFYILWSGTPLPYVTAWLPLSLFAVDKSVRGSLRGAGPLVAVVTCLILVSGQVDIAGQLLLASGCYAIWCVVDEYRQHWRWVAAVRAITRTGSAWIIGFLLAAPYLLPLLEYVNHGARMNQRRAGFEERPPIGLSALPQVIMPDYYGSTQHGSLLIQPTEAKGGNLQESAGGTYVGLLTTLLATPLAWCSRRRRSRNVFWIVLCIVALSWVLDVPGLVAVLRLPFLRMMSHNRLVFISAFAILALAVEGIDSIWQHAVRWHWTFLLPLAVLLCFGGWCLYRAFNLPEPIASVLERHVRAGKSAPVGDVDAVREIQNNFRQAYTRGAALSGLALAVWWLVMNVRGRAWLGPAVGTAMVAELVWFAYGRNPQTSSSLYYPRLPVLAKLARMTSDRVLGIDCLPPLLNELYGLRDIRGYDTVDPLRYTELLSAVRDEQFSSPTYAAMRDYVPRLDAKVPGIINMLNVRYVIFRGPLPHGVVPVLQSEDYWIVENPRGLPRAFVPVRVHTVADKEEMLRRLAATDFDPRQAAYLEEAHSLSGECHGTASIVSETPTDLTVTVQTDAAGLLVLSDLYYAGWKAYLNGRESRLLCANYALRGVVVPSGRSEVRFRYEPASLTWGVRLMSIGFVSLSLWAAVARLNCFIRSRTHRHQREATSSPAGNCKILSVSPRFFSFRWCRACDSFVLIIRHSSFFLLFNLDHFTTPLPDYSR